MTRNRKYEKAMEARDIDAAVAALGLEDIGWDIYYTVRDVVVDGVQVFPADTRVLASPDLDSDTTWPMVWLALPDGRVTSIRDSLVALALDFILDHEPETYFALRFEDKSFFRSLRKDVLYTMDAAQDAKHFKTADAAVLYGGKVFAAFGWPLRVVHVRQETMDVKGFVRTISKIEK